MSEACPRGHGQGGGLLQRLRTPMRPDGGSGSRGSVERCPNCGSPPASATPASSAATSSGRPTSSHLGGADWEVLVRPDRAFYESRSRTGWTSPTTSRRFLLTGDHLRIGRRSSTRASKPRSIFPGRWRTRGSPIATLSDAPARWRLGSRGPGVDKRHVPQRRCGTHARRTIPCSSDGDQIHIGALTTLTVERGDPPIPVTEATTGPPRTPATWPGAAGHGSGSAGSPAADVSGKASAHRPQDPGHAGRAGPPGRDTVSRPTSSGRSGATTRPKTAGKALQGYIASLRKVLPVGAIETTPQGGYRLVGSKDVVDVSGSSVSARGGGPSWPRVTPGRPPPSSAGRSSCGGVSPSSTWPTVRPGGRPRWWGSWSAGRPPRRTSSRPVSSSGTTGALADLRSPWKRSPSASAAGPS